MARPILGSRLVENLEASAEAKRRLRVILETAAGRQSVADACEELGLSEARFHEIRRQALQGALESLEGAPAGRPSERSSELESLRTRHEEELAQVRLELEAARVREQIAATMPHLLQSRRSGAEKKTPKKPGRPPLQDIFGPPPGTTGG